MRINPWKAIRDLEWKVECLERLIPGRNLELTPSRRKQVWTAPSCVHGDCGHRTKHESGYCAWHRNMISAQNGLVRATETGTRGDRNGGDG